MHDASKPAGRRGSPSAGDDSATLGQDLDIDGNASSCRLSDGAWLSGDGLAEDGLGRDGLGRRGRTPGVQRVGASDATIVLVLVVLAVVFVGWWWRSSQSAKRELAAKQELTAMGVLVVMDATGSHVASVNLSMIPADKSLDRAVELLASFSQLNSLDASRTPFNDEHAAILGRIKSLNTVTLNDSELTDAGLAQLAKLSNLEALNVTLNVISDAGLGALQAASKLKVLDLSGTQVSGNLAPLARLPDLAWLALRNCTLEESALDALATSPALRQLSLESATVSKAAIKRLKVQLPELQVGTGSLAAPPEMLETPQSDSPKAEDTSVQPSPNQ